MSACLLGKGTPINQEFRLSIGPRRMDKMLRALSEKAGEIGSLIGRLGRVNGWRVRARGVRT